PGFDSDVATIALQEDGHAIVGGYFVSAGDALTGTTQVRAHAARLRPDGTVEMDFDPARGAAVYAMAKRADGSVLVGGSFRTFAGVTRYNLALMDAEGRLVEGFAPVVNGAVHDIKVLPNGGFVIAGTFTRVDN